ncbi:MAG: Crp/Fnr family transcriptional regulator [Alphaproteobacteria bacterium]|nr:Crp/Fnr family transcriptional regulator [Alphaproteobacteria bacterium]
MDLLDFGLKPLRDHLSEAVKGEVRRRAQRRRFEDKQALHMRGDDEARLCIVASGMVRFGRFQHDGSFKLLAMLGPGAHYGDVALQRHAFTQNVYALGPTEIDVIDAAALEILLRDQPELAVALWRCNTARLNAVLELYDDARTLNVTARLAKVIYVHMGRGEVANGVACLQRDLAELLGVSKVALGNAMRDLERAGLVQSGYRRIIVLNKAKLKSWLRTSGSA